MPWEEERTRVKEAKYEKDMKTRRKCVVRNNGPERVSCLSNLTYKHRVTHRDSQRQKRLIIYHLHSDGPSFSYTLTQ